MWQWNRLSIRIVPSVKGEKGIEFRFECGARLKPIPEACLLSRVFRSFFPQSYPDSKVAW